MGSAMNVLGIDVGATGALAVLTAEGELIEAFDMPSLDDGPAGRGAVGSYPPLAGDGRAKGSRTTARAVAEGRRSP
jgi:hypothetical protein